MAHTRVGRGGFGKFNKCIEEILKYMSFQDFYYMCPVYYMYTAYIEGVAEPHMSNNGYTPYKLLHLPISYKLFVKNPLSCANMN